MTHMLLDEGFQEKVEDYRMDIVRMWPEERLKPALTAQLGDVWPGALLLNPSEAAYVIAQITLAVEQGVIS